MASRVDHRTIEEMRQDLRGILTQLMVTEPFFALWIRSLPIYASMDADTAYTDGVAIYINPEFWHRLDGKAKAAVLLHEALHILLRHPLRTPELAKRYPLYPPTIYNVVADAKVNQLIPRAVQAMQRSGIEPVTPEILAKFLEVFNITREDIEKKSYEEIIAKLCHELKKRGRVARVNVPRAGMQDLPTEQQSQSGCCGQQSQGKQQQQQGGSSGSQQSQRGGQNQQGQRSSGQQQNQCSSRGGQQTQQGQHSRGSQGSGQQQSNQQSRGQRGPREGQPCGGGGRGWQEIEGYPGPSGARNTDVNGSGSTTATTTATTDTQPQPSQGREQGSAGASGSQTSQQSQQGQQPGAPKKPRIDGVINEGDERFREAQKSGDPRKIEETIRRRIVEITVNVKQIGRLPGALASLIRELTKPRIDWRRQLRSAILPMLGSAVFRSFTAVNKKFFANGIEDVPGKRLYGLQKVIVLVDTSGSISDQELKQFISEVYGIFKDARPEEIIVIPWDATAYEPIKIRNRSDVNKLKYMPGRGGTMIHDALELCSKMMRRGDIVIVLSDWHIRDIGYAEVQSLLRRIASLALAALAITVDPGGAQPAVPRGWRTLRLAWR